MPWYQPVPVHGYTPWPSINDVDVRYAECTPWYFFSSALLSSLDLSDEKVSAP